MAVPTGFSFRTDYDGSQLYSAPGMKDWSSRQPPKTIWSAAAKSWVPNPEYLEWEELGRQYRKMANPLGGLMDQGPPSPFKN